MLISNDTNLAISINSGLCKYSHVKYTCLLMSCFKKVHKSTAVYLSLEKPCEEKAKYCQPAIALPLTESNGGPSGNHNGKNVRGKVVMVMGEHKVAGPGANVPYRDIGNLEEVFCQMLKDG